MKTESWIGTHPIGGDFSFPAGAADHADSAVAANAKSAAS